jgi:hypothetical protein
MAIKGQSKADRITADLLAQFRGDPEGLKRAVLNAQAIARTEAQHRIALLVKVNIIRMMQPGSI